MIGILDKHGYRRTKRQAVLHSGQDTDTVGFLPRRGQTALSGPPPVKLGLDFVDIERQARRTPVHNGAYRGPVRFPEGRYPEDCAEYVAHVSAPYAYLHEE